MPEHDDPLNAATAVERLSALRGMPAYGPRDALPTGEVNNHVHTSYSFSPYSPTKAAERARYAGLLAVGIVDHDTLAGAAEMREAGKILGIATTTGVELRVSAAGTLMEGRKINNPDSPGIMYMMIHGVPRRSVPLIEGFLAPVRASRERRSRRMVEEMNALLPGLGLDAIDFLRDVRAASQAADGGTVTERHILLALSIRIVEAEGRGDRLCRFLRGKLGVEISGRVEKLLLDEGNPFIHYDLLGLLKSSFLPRIFIQPDEDECVPVRSAVRLAEEADAIPCYGYLGDVVDSPTGDKKAEKFEDEYLEDVMAEVKRLGFRAVTYMPPRNTMEQLKRVRALCAAHGLMEISGVDINSPRQSFRCPEILLPEFSHLIASTWALIAHENLADAEDRYGLFRPDNPLAGLPLAERTLRYAAVGESLDRLRPDSAAAHPLVAAWEKQI
jgi:hypothetical protein